MSVNGLSFPTMTNKVNILITISTYLTVALALYETAQLITAIHCQPMPTYANLCQPMPTYERPTVSRDQRSLQPMPTYANQGPIKGQSLRDLRSRAIKDRSNHDPNKLIKIVIKMLTLFVMVDNGRQ